MRVIVAMGANIDAQSNLERAVIMLGRQFVVVAVSPVYETLPVGTSEQPCFLNAAALVETQLEPAEVKGVLRTIEDALGRVRTADKYGPRAIDLDIVLVWIQGAIETVDPDVVRYAHVARPVADLVPDLRLEHTGERLEALAQRLSQEAIVSRQDIDLNENLRGD